VGYCEASKAFRIYIPGHHHIKINRDVTFDEDATLKKSRRCQLEKVYEEEPVAPRVAKLVRKVPRVEKPVREVIASPDEEILEDHDIVEFQEPPQMMISIRESLLGLRRLFKIERSMVFPKEPRDR
jgi:hypothetical protein